MKKSLKLTVAVALALGTTSVYATNGVNLIGTSAKSRAMGGVGIGMAMGADSGFSNPALISSVEGTEVSFGGTLFMPKVSTTGANTLTTTDSEADQFIVPEVGFAMKASDNFYWGIGMWGASGLGVDYRNDDNGNPFAPAANDGTNQLVTNYQALQLIVPLTYKTGGLSLSVAPVLNYGALDSNWDQWCQTCFGGGPGLISNSAGVSQDLAFGANLGAAYQTGDLTVGGVYKSSIKMDYTGQPALDPTVLAAFGITGVTEGRLDVPAEYGVGASYVIGGKHTVALDVKTIKYGSTKGWEDFGWKDQNVIALGYQFDAGKWALRAGYNYGKAPVENLSIADPTNGNPGRNYFNAVGFPATVEQHVTVGGSYQFSKQMGLDVAFTYAPQKEGDYDTFVDTDADDIPDTPVSVSTKHSQTALTAGLTFKF
jgi:long-chain fatty acid transport protein